MFIFLEGPDAAGKSNLAARLSEAYGYEKAKFSYPKTSHEKRHMFEMYSEFIHSHKDIIVDRCWYSEMVYGPIVRKEYNMSRVKMYELERLVVSQGGGMVIHCTADIEKLWERFSKRGDDYIENDIELLKQIKNRYEYLLHTTQHNIPVFRYEINENMPRL